MAKAKTAKRGHGFVITRGVRVSGLALAQADESDKARTAREAAGKQLRRQDDEVLVPGDEERLAELIELGIIDADRLVKMGAIGPEGEEGQGAPRRAPRTSGDSRVNRALRSGDATAGFPDDYPLSDAQRKAIVEAGLDSPAKVENASDEELLGIDGIGEATVEKLRGLGK